LISPAEGRNGSELLLKITLPTNVIGIGGKRIMNVYLEYNRLELDGHGSVKIKIGGKSSCYFCGGLSIL
jgi:hypothetical protein